jgi:hypothetical protein
MPVKVETPRMTELKDALGAAWPLWNEVIQTVETICTPVTFAWKPFKTGFGRMGLLQHKKKTLVYLTPDKGKIWVAIVLGERAFQLAMTSSLPQGIKNLFLEAKPYAEGRGIRYFVDSQSDIPTIANLIQIKITPP